MSNLSDDRLLKWILLVVTLWTSRPGDSHGLFSSNIPVTRKGECGDSIVVGQVSAAQSPTHNSSVLGRFASSGGSLISLLVNSASLFWPSQIQDSFPHYWRARRVEKLRWPSSAWWLASLLYYNIDKLKWAAGSTSGRLT
jgi:hypothetical protein